jgi:hypothetical protein
MHIPQLQVGKLVKWKKEHLALCKVQAKSKDLTEAKDEEKPPSPISDMPIVKNEEDTVNYSLQVLQLGTLLVQLHDTEKEGDGERSLRNMKLLTLYFITSKRHEICF